MNDQEDTPGGDSTKGSKPTPDLDALLMPVTEAKRALDAAAAAFHAAQRMPEAALSRLIAAETDFGHPIMHLTLLRTLAAVGSGSEFIPAVRKVLETVRLIETKGTEFCIANITTASHAWRFWYGTCTGQRIEIDTGKGRRRTLFPFDIRSFGSTLNNSVRVPEEEDPVTSIKSDLNDGLVSRIAGVASPICEWVVAFGTAEIEEMISQSNQWHQAAFARSVVECGRGAAFAQV